MTGFINRLFRRGSQPAPSPTQAAQPQKGGAFFLDPDDAKTYGDIEYMRTARKVRKTFMGGKMEVIEEISATEKRILDQQGGERQSQSTVETSSASASAAPRATPQVERRRASSDLDMFRNMAKDLGKKD